MRRLAPLLFVLASALVLHAQSVDELLKSADQHSAEGRIVQARAAYERAIKAGARLEGDYLRARNLGLCYLNGAPPDFNKAAQWLGYAVQVNQRAVETRQSLAQAFAWSGRYDEALTQYRILVTSQPNNSEYVLGLANTLQWKKDSAGAVRTLELYLEKFPSNTQVRLEYARILSYAQRYAEAMSQYQGMLQADPNSIDAQIGMAKVTSWQGHLDRSLEMYNRVLRRNPSSYDAIVGKAYALYWMGRVDEARPLFVTARGMHSGDKDIQAILRAIGATKRETDPVAVPLPAQPVHAAVKPARVEELVVAQPEVYGPPTGELPLFRGATAQPDPATALMRAAEASAARTDYPVAIRNYRLALAADPQRHAARLQLARVLQWSRQFQDATHAYVAYLEAQPQNAEVRLEHARVLSWSEQYADSIAQYDRALADARTSAALPPSQLTDATIERIRVLSWARRYDDCIRDTETVLAAGDISASQRSELLLLKARVLSWNRRYDEALTAYRAAEQGGASRFDSLFGQGQVLYWSGRLEESRHLLRSLAAEKSDDPNVRYTLAAVERTLGHNGRALSLLRPLNTAEARELRESIAASVRPIARFRFGFENDNEIASNGATSATRIQRFSSALEFNIHPDVRMEVTTLISESDTSNPALGRVAPDAFMPEVFARITFAPASWLRLTLGAGDAGVGASPGDRRHHTLLYDVHPVILRGPLRVDLSFTRRAADYTPLAVHNRVVTDRQAIAASYDWRNYRGGIEYFHAAYRLTDALSATPYRLASDGAAASILRRWSPNETFEAELGPRYELFGFDRRARAIADPVNGIGSTGFFAPELFHRAVATGQVRWTAANRVAFETGGSLGAQRVSAPFGPAPAFGASGSFFAQTSRNFSKTKPYIRYDYFGTQTPSGAGQSSGAYRSHLLSVGVELRF